MMKQMDSRYVVNFNELLILGDCNEFLCFVYYVC